MSPLLYNTKLKGLCTSQHRNNWISCVLRFVENRSINITFLFFYFFLGKFTTIKESDTSEKIDVSQLNAQQPNASLSKYMNHLVVFFDVRILFTTSFVGNTKSKIPFSGFSSRCHISFLLVLRLSLEEIDSKPEETVFEFHLVQMPLGKSEIHLFSLQLSVNSRAYLTLKPWQGNSSRRKTSLNLLILSSRNRTGNYERNMNHRFIKAYLFRR